MVKTYLGTEQVVSLNKVSFFEYAFCIDFEVENMHILKEEYFVFEVVKHFLQINLLRAFEQNCNKSWKSACIKTRTRNAPCLFTHANQLSITIVCVVWRWPSWVLTAFLESNYQTVGQNTLTTFSPFAVNREELASIINSGLLEKTQKNI